MDDPRYPVGKFQAPPEVTPAMREASLRQIEEAPAKLRAAVEGLSSDQLDTAYRDGGWTVRQVVHHLPDSHLNAYVRHRLALTEDEPTIKPYKENLWAELPDARTAPVDLSLSILDAVHRRWAILLRSLSEDQWKRTFRHPEQQALIVLEKNVAMYAWHGRHHVGHITSLRERKGW